jgi:hypothetical protein
VAKSGRGSSNIKKNESTADLTHLLTIRAEPITGVLNEEGGILLKCGGIYEVTLMVQRARADDSVAHSRSLGHSDLETPLHLPLYRFLLKGLC